MDRSGMKRPACTWASIAILLVVSGCAECGLPRIDPSGEHLFIYDKPPPQPTATCPPGTVPTLPPAAPAVASPTPSPAPRSARDCPTCDGFAADLAL